MNSPCSLKDSSASEPESETSEVRDPLRAYFREVSKHPPMRREEERAIAQRVRMGDKEAGQKMVLANLRLVVRIALHCRNDSNLPDLIQEGNIGLMHAVGKYDPDLGIRFSTYATFWIRARMGRYLMDTWSMVKIGTTDSHRKLFYSLKREKERLERSGVIPSARLLADNLDVTALEIEDVEQRLYHGDVSLEAPQHEDGNPLMDTIGSGEDIEGALIEKDTAEMLHKRLGTFKKRLNERECFILDNRIMAEDPLTLEEIGQRYNTTRESVRQIQVKISKNLARNLRSSEIRPSM
ncbi:MAG: sigma-70 family RNA polymerase sigma factor [Syntrophorhabdales bacterium]